jgi:hypothetical protein
MAAPNLDKCTPQQVDSFCEVYTKMLVDEQDAVAATKLPRNIKDRMLLNEKLYRQHCPQAA